MFVLGVQKELTTTSNNPIINIVYENRNLLSPAKSQDKRVNQQNRSNYSNADIKYCDTGIVAYNNFWTS